MLLSIQSKAYIDDIAVVTETSDSVRVTDYSISFFYRDRLGSMTAEHNLKNTQQK